MRYLSVCSGIEAATVAWHPLGWEPAAFSEIEAFPRAVLQHHYPEVPLHSDFTTIGADDYGAIDLLVGGTPCQSFSIAGLRGGLDDDRGNLALEFLRLADRKRPRWLVWENVPGVLSIDEGRAFGSILGGMGELGYGFAYRILDAQHFGVPQRRRRVFVVGYLGDWRRAAAVLFERHSLSGHSAPRREAREGFARRTAFGISPDCLDRSGEGAGGTAAERSGLGVDREIAYALRAKRAGAVAAFGGGNCAGAIDVATAQTAHGVRMDFDTETFVTHSLRGEGFDASEDGTGRGTPLVPVAFDCKGTEVQFTTNGVHPTLRSMGHKNSHTNAGGHAAVAYDLRGREDGAQMEGPHDTANIRAASGGSSRSYVAASAVRRLTPRECERLQGFPDDYTLIPYRNKPAADGPRYKALGNSFAVPVVRWLGERIQAVEGIIKKEAIRAA